MSERMHLTDDESNFLQRVAAVMREDAAWNPDTFLGALADWLDHEARTHDGDEWGGLEHSLVTARAYLGGTELQGGAS